jgi:hypothetical protein
MDPALANFERYIYNTCTCGQQRTAAFACVKYTECMHSLMCVFLLAAICASNIELKEWGRRVIRRGTSVYRCTPVHASEPRV